MASWISLVVLFRATQRRLRGERSPVDACFTVTNEVFYEIEHCECVEDLCNGSSGDGVTLLLAAATLAALRLLD